MEIFPSSTVANLKWNFLKQFTGDWEVALVEIQYAHTWSTMHNPRRTPHDLQRTTHDARPTTQDPRRTTHDAR